MNLPDAIRAYYFVHFDELPFHKQFHFVSRLSAWNADARATELLASYRTRLAPSDQGALQQVLSLYRDPPTVQINSLTARQPYFDAYPELQGLDLALFRLRHLKTIYDIDLTADFSRIYPSTKLHRLADALEHDREAILTLSTYAINYIFLVRYILYSGGSSAAFVQYVHNIALESVHETPEQIQLLIYLYTHCIICDTNFYDRAVNPENIASFRDMLVELEQIIIDNYDNIHLDNKFEYLVCCRILNYLPSSQLTDRIDTEAEQSLSDNGDFLIDRHNAFGQKARVTFPASEHRNVLFIMSRSEYPHLPHEPST